MKFFLSLSIALILFTNVQAQKLPYLNPKLPVENRVKDLLGRMTLEEKIAQMDLWSINDRKSPDLKIEIETYGLGGILSAMTAEQANQLRQMAKKQRLKIPILFQIDACHGNALVEGSTVFPTNISMAASFNKQLAYQIARSTATEVRAYGHRAVYTPTIDVIIDPRFGRTGETFGECPYLTSVMASAYTKGFQDDLNNAGVVCCPKHFVGGGASVGGNNHASAEISDRTMREVFLKPFKAAVDAGALMIMAGHNDVNGVPVHASHDLLTKILKKEWGFKGFVVSDMGDVRNLTLGKLHDVVATHEEALAKSINAGVDMYMNSKNLNEFFYPMIKLVKTGKISKERIDDAVRRILRVKFSVGCFEDKDLDVKEQELAVGTTQAKNAALQGARECITLLKNDEKILPISINKYKKIFVTGPNVNDQSILGDWAVAQKSTITILDGIKTIAGKDCEVNYFNCGRIRGKAMKITEQMIETADPRIIEQNLSDSKSEINDWSIQEAVKQAMNNDLTIVAVGGNAIRANWALRTYGESGDMPTVGLYGKQLELVKALKATGKPVVVILVSGKVVSEPWINDSISTLVYAWEPGIYGGQAMAEILFGKVNPSGKTPITFPKTDGHIPQYYYQRSSRFWTGYFDGTNKPAFPFGFGLSYTTYTYSNLVVPNKIPINSTEIPISVTVTNSGKMDGDESVLLFVHDVVADVAPVVKMLKGFEKIHLKAGESKTITFNLPLKELKYYNSEMKNVLDPGEFKVMINNQTKSFWVE